jgi:AcrR family transcriptional regulator
MARAYESTLREAQARTTRLRVLDAVIGALARQEEITISQLAKEAGVSVPTIYRYFPTREAMMDAVQEVIGTRLGRPKWPDSATELLARVPQRYSWLEENGLLIRAILSSALGREVKRAVERRRERAMLRVIDAHASRLGPKRARAIGGVIAALDDAHTWRELRDEWGVSGEDAAWAAEWAMRALLERLELDARTTTRRARRRRPTTCTAGGTTTKEPSGTAPRAEPSPRASSSRGPTSSR